MRRAIIVSLVGATLCLSPSGFPQDSQKPTWRPCPRCVLDSKNADAVEKLKDHSFEPRDLSGVWGNNDLLLDTKTVPPLTAWGKQQYEATKAEESAAGVAISNSKDGMLICDPLGYPRSLFVNDGFEFVMLPDRVLQFFEWS